MNEERIKTVVEDLERMLLAFMRKHQITNDEYRHATDILVRSIMAGEDSLLLDVFFAAEATDIGNLGQNASPQAIEGPFYVPGAPALEPPYIVPQRPTEGGDPLYFSGCVKDTDGEPLAGTEMDFWQADADGLYSNIHPGIPDWNLRGRFRTDVQGRFEVKTILPPPYEIPKNGPAGRLLSVLGRHFFRPAHLHVKLRHSGYKELTSQIYFQGSDYIDSDVANAVRDGLVVPLQRKESADELAARNLQRAYWEVKYDFRLLPD
jgi:catechol 1,2-dioxygenase